MKRLLVFVFAVAFLGSCGKKGCTDIYSVDYDSEATKDDGLCSNERDITITWTMDTTGWEAVEPDIVCQHSSFPNGEINVNLDQYSQGINTPSCEASVTFRLEKGEIVYLEAISFHERNNGTEEDEYLMRIVAQINETTIEIQPGRDINSSDVTEIYWTVP